MKKIVSLFLTLCMIIPLFASLPTMVNAAATSGIYSYTISNGEVTITDCSTAANGAIEIPSTLEGYPVTGISAYGFRDCVNLISITIPNSVTSIGDWAFMNCESLTSITVDEQNPAYSSIDGNLFNKSKTTLIQYAREKNNNTYTIPDSVTTIGDGAFSHCTNLTNITIPNSVISVGRSAFFQCVSLTSITIPNSVTSIGAMAFFNCDGLASIIIPNSVTSIGGGAFENCSGLTSITIPNSVTSIGGGAFHSCRYLTSITIPDSVTFIYSHAFMYCTSLKDVYYASSEKDWNKVNIEKKGNERLISATIHFNSTGPNVPDKPEKPTEPEPDEPNENISTNKLLTKMALCKAVYNNLKEEVTIKQLIDDGKLTEGNKRMFYDPNTKQTTKWKTFIERYAGDMEVIETLSEEKTGFYGAAFKDSDGDIIIAYRGTNDDKMWERDWWTTNIPMTLGIDLSTQFTKALELYNTVKMNNADANIELTGHSLGGALASYVAIMNGIRTDNVNGATGWMFNNFVAVDPSCLLAFKGFDVYINEMYDQKIFNSNWLVTMANRGSFNYSLYDTTPLLNKFKKGEELPDLLDNDYHAISSIIDYKDGQFDFTKVTKKYVFDKDFVGFGGALMGTTKDNRIASNIYNSPFYVDERTGTAIAPTFQQRTEFENNPYMIPGMPDNSNKVVLGGDGNDTVRLFGGHDKIIGGAGDDTLNGGAGNDTYYFGENWGHDVITDVSGKDVLFFTDTELDEISIEKTSNYILLTSGNNSVKIMKQGRQLKGSSMVINACRCISNDIFTTDLPTTFSLRNTAVENGTSKMLYIAGVAQLEIYDVEGNLQESVSNTETNTVSGDYGIITLSNEDEQPYIQGVFTENDYSFKISSDASVLCSMSMNADSQDINNLSVITTEIPAGAKLETSTVPNAQGKAEFALVYEDETSVAVENIPLQSVESIAVELEKNTIYTGEEISLSAIISPQDALIQTVDWMWESEDGEVGISQDEEGNVTLIGTKAGTVTIRATANDGSGIYGEATLEVRSDSAPSVVMTSNNETYVSGNTAYSPVKITVGSVDGYETVVEGNCDFDIENNCYTVVSNGDFDIEIYGKNAVTGAITEVVKVNVVQEVPRVEILATAINGTTAGSGVYLKDTNVTLNATPDAGYKFSGWYVGDTLVSQDANYTFKAECDIELTANFTKKTSAPIGGGGGGVPTCSIKFESNGGSAVKAITVNKNAVATEPTAPTKDGFKFEGWYTDKELTTAYDFAEKVVKSITLYAKWTEVDVTKNQIILTIGDKNAKVFGVDTPNDVAPKIVNDRTMLPARFVAESLGATVIWTEAEPNKVLIQKDNIEIVIHIGSDIAFVNGEEVVLDSPAFIENERTYTPIRFIAEELGAKVEWLPETQQVVIEKQ